MANNKLQLHFFEYLQQVMPPNTSLAEELSDTLGISLDSVYRRLRGETNLTIAEVSQLCNRYQVSFDRFAGASSQVPFMYDKLDSTEGFELYLTSILKDMKQIEQADDNEIVYAAVDVPIFHHFRYPELSAFKMFYWMKAVVDVPELADKSFSVQHVNQRFADLGKAIYETYTHIPSIEIWTEETINSLLKQIEFYWESGHFETPGDALTICEQVKEEVNTLQLQSEKSNKLMRDSAPGNTSFELFVSDIEIGNNCIYTRRGELELIYLSVHTFNKVITQHTGFVNDTSLWLSNLMKKSTLISGVSEKNRYRFFKTIEKKIERLCQKIKEQE